MNHVMMIEWTLLLKAWMFTNSCTSLHHMDHQFDWLHFYHYCCITCWATILVQSSYFCLLLHIIYILCEWLDFRPNNQFWHIIILGKNCHVSGLQNIRALTFYFLLELGTIYVCVISKTKQNHYFTSYYLLQLMF